MIPGLIARTYQEHPKDEKPGIIDSRRHHTAGGGGETPAGASGKGQWKGKGTGRRNINLRQGAAQESKNGSISTPHPACRGEKKWDRHVLGN